jgi:hypothetical protein
VIEVIEKYREKPEPPLTPQRCVELLIGTIDGADEKETKMMRMTLEKVLVEGSTVQGALAPFKLGHLQERLFWLKTTPRFRTKLQFLIDELNRYQSRL